MTDPQPAYTYRVSLNGDDLALCSGPSGHEAAALLFCERFGSALARVAPDPQHLAVELLWGSAFEAVDQDSGDTYFVERLDPQ